MNGRLELGDISPSAYFFGIAVVCGLVFAAITEPASGFYGLLKHGLQWQLQTVLPMLFLVLTHTGLQHTFRPRQLNPWLTLSASALIACILFTPVALAVEQLLGQQAISLGATAALSEFAATAPPVTLVCLGINAPWILGYRISRANEAPESRSVPPIKEAEEQAGIQSDEDGSANFLSLLPADKVGSLIYLEAELHYLSVVTSKGRSLILYNLKDAIAELSAESGIQVHRSFWVAIGQIDRLTTEGRQGRVILKSGESLPVSRQRLKSVKAALTVE